MTTNNANPVIPSRETGPVQRIFTNRERGGNAPGRFAEHRRGYTPEQFNCWNSSRQASLPPDATKDLKDFYRAEGGPVSA